MGRGLSILAGCLFVLGTWVVPAAADQVGYASYYKHGQRTANGERFEPKGLTAAHRSLPFGTKVRVTNVKTRKSVVVRINDRGPFKKHRVIDLSLGAASAIGLVRAGVAKVELVILVGK
jgi:rare lipoprotein A